MRHVSLFVFLIALCLAPARAETLRQALDAATARAPQAQWLATRQQESAARRQVADSLLAGAPVLGVGQREGDRGRSEFELELAAPLWLPGQRQASVALADAQAAENSAAQAAQRLALAGELREAVAALRAARAELDLLRAHAEFDRRLAEEVARRVTAGDLARSDLLLARNEALAAEVAALEADSRVAQASQRYQALTGLEALPSDADEPLAPPPAAHPLVASLEHKAAQAHAGLELARRTRGEPVELGVQYQHSRDINGSPFQDSVRVGVRIPFSGERRNRPALAAANSAWVQAEAELRQIQAELETQQRAARAVLGYAERAAELGQARQQAADEHLRLIRKGFALGELSLAQLLLSQRQQREAESAAVQAHLALLAGRAHLNQVLGVLP